MATFTQKPTNTLTHHDLFLEAREYFKNYFLDTEFSDCFFTDDDILYDGPDYIGKIMGLNKAISMYVNDEEECFYNETMNEVVENFAMSIGNTYTNFGYDEENNFLYFNKPEDLEAVLTAFHETMGKCVIEMLADDYWSVAKKYLLAGYQMIEHYDVKKGE